MRSRFALATAGLAVTLLLGLAPAAVADEPVPTPTPTESTPTEEPAPVADPAPAPVPVTAPAPAPASSLPLRVGAHGWRVSDVQDRLQWLGYEIYDRNVSLRTIGRSTEAAVKKFQFKFGYVPSGVVGPKTWSLLRTVSGRVGQLPASCRGERTICIDKAQRLLRYVVDDRVVLTLDARFGFVGAETSEGTFRIRSKSRDHVSTLYRTAMPFAMFFNGGQAVHYSQYFARDGYNGASHGCVNLRDYAKAQWLFDHTPTGTRVYVYR